MASPNPIRLGPGEFTLTADQVSAVSVTFVADTVLVVKTDNLHIKAPTIIWEGKVEFRLSGDNGPNGLDVAEDDFQKWCMSENAHNWEADWASATPDRGKAGGDGENGVNGKNIIIEAGNTIVAGGTSITFFAGGGRGGRPGAGGRGARFTLCKTGDDCNNGTNQTQHKDGPPGPHGRGGVDGDGGQITFSSKTRVDPKLIHVKGGMLIFDAPSPG